MYYVPGVANPMTVRSYVYYYSYTIVIIVGQTYIVENYAQNFVKFWNAINSISKAKLR